MKVHIERFTNILLFMKKYAYISSINYSTDGNSTYTHDLEKERFDIKKPIIEFMDYFKKVPTQLNDNIMIIYRLLGDFNREIYIDDWCFLSLKESLNRYEYYKSRGQYRLYDIAYKYEGLGHIKVLSCDLDNHLLFYRYDGGSNDLDRENNLTHAIEFKRNYLNNKDATKRRKINSLKEINYTYFMYKDFINNIKR